MAKDNKHEIVIKNPDKLLKKLNDLHPSDIAYSLKKIEKHSTEDFFRVVKSIPEDLLGEVILELPDNLRDDVYEELSIEKLTDIVDELESDDATDIIQEIEELNEEKAKEVFEGLEENDQKEINWLRRYDEDEAGSYMQTELFSASVNETIQESLNRLKQSKDEDELENIHQVYIVNEDKSLVASILLEDLILLILKKLIMKLFLPMKKIDLNLML